MYPVNLKKKLFKVNLQVNSEKCCLSKKINRYFMNPPLYPSEEGIFGIYFFDKQNFKIYLCLKL